jgi:hypothetical protein
MEGSSETNYSSFTLNYTLMQMNVSVPGNFSPGTSFTIYINMSYVNGGPFNINTTAFSFNFSASNILNCSPLTNTNMTAGKYNSSCTVNYSALAGAYTLRGNYPNANANDSFAVNVSYQSAKISALNNSISMDIGRQRNVTINLSSSSNIDDIIQMTNGCDGINLTCDFNVTNITAKAFDNVSVRLTINSASDADNATYTISVSAKSLNDTSKTNQTNISVTVYPFHNFSLAANAPLTNDSVPPGMAAPYSFVVTNTGNSTSYSFSCNSSSGNFTCGFNATNGTSINAGENPTIGVNVTVLNATPVGEWTKTDIYVTDAYGLTKLLEGALPFKTTIGESLGNVSVTNISQYFHNPGETYYFNITINNTGNVNNHTEYDVNITTVSATWLVLSLGSITVSNMSDFSNGISLNDTNSSNFRLHIGALNSTKISVRVVVPSTASYLNWTRLHVSVVSLNNSNISSGNISLNIKLPYYNVSANMAYNKTGENLTWYLINVTREPGVGLTLTALNVSIRGNDTYQFSSVNVTFGTVFSSNTTNRSLWPSGSYDLNVTGNSTDNYNFSWKGTFYIARGTAPALTAAQISGIIYGTTFNVTATVLFELTGISINNTTNENPSAISGSPKFLGINGSTPSGDTGGTCSTIPFTNTTYIYACTAYPQFNNTYNMSYTADVSKCSLDFNCSYSPSLSNLTSKTFGLMTSAVITPPSNQSGSQSPPPASNTTNRTTTTTTGLKFTVPSNVTLLNTSQTIYITLNNTNTSRQNVSVNISEASDYLHFNLTYVAPKNISGNSTSTINITLTPFKWAKPGNYTVSITINSMNTTLTVTVPQSNVTKKIYRYVEVSKNRAKSMVTLIVKNRNSYSVFMNVTENISKQIAASAKNVTIISAVNYTIIEEDPVIMWMMNMSQNQERSVIYLVAGDLGNSNLFNEPNVTEGRMSTGGGGGTTAKGEDMTWLIIGIIVVVVIVAAVVVYLFFLKPRGIKLPIKYGAFVKQEKKGAGVLDVLKGVLAKIMSIFKREKKEAPAGEKKSIFSRLSFKKRAEIKEEPKKEEKKIAPGKPKPTKEDLLKKLNEVYKK